MTAALNYLGISNSGGYKPVNVIALTYTLVAGGEFITNNSSGVTYTLPVSARLGTRIAIIGNVGTWIIKQNANQQILVGSQSSTVGTGGSVSSTSSGCIELVCITAGASTVWRAATFSGSLTVV
jgi:hypothetical protein